MILCIPVTPDGMTAPGWGRTHRVAVANASGSDVSEWREFDVGWDTSHDEGTEGAHHARVARFLIDHHVDVVVAEHMGPGMTRMLTTMGIRVWLGADGEARAAVLAAVHQVP
jgi:predicted Fe-Mo cluster-binding NifX family protein